MQNNQNQPKFNFGGISGASKQQSADQNKEDKKNPFGTIKFDFGKKNSNEEKKAEANAKPEGIGAMKFNEKP